MQADVRLYRRSTIIQMGVDEETLDTLEVGYYSSKDGRFQLITNRGQLQIPACSYISRSDDDPWFIDTGVEIDEGQLYIGRTDFEGLASVAGYVSSASVQRTFDENERLKSELDTCHRLITDLRTAVGDLVGLSTVDRTNEGTVTQLPSEDEPRPRKVRKDVEELDLTIEGE
jgi:hypothetical protein